MSKRVTIPESINSIRIQKPYVKLIKRWLDFNRNDKYTKCPFNEGPHRFACFAVCLPLFPKIDKREHLHKLYCPCFKYREETVVKRARQIVYGGNNEKGK